MTPPRPPTAPLVALSDPADPVVTRLGQAIDPPGRLHRAGALARHGVAHRRGLGHRVLGLAHHRGRVRGLRLHPAGPGEHASSTSTPAGGDMGAHVWAPAYLRDHLLHVVPPHRLDPRLVRRLPRVPVLHGAPVAGDRPAELRHPLRRGLQAGGHQRGAVACRSACWAFGKLTRLPFPAPPLLAVAATVFLFDRSFSIYGGNIASTLAGEFAFSISLSASPCCSSAWSAAASRRAATARWPPCCWRSPGCAT